MVAGAVVARGCQLDWVSQTSSHYSRPGGTEQLTHQLGVPVIVLASKVEAKLCFIASLKSHIMTLPLCPSGNKDHTLEKSEE